MKPAPAVVMATAWPVMPVIVVACGWAFSLVLSLFWLQGWAVLGSALLHGLCLVLIVLTAVRHGPGWLMWTGESWRLDCGGQAEPGRPRVSHEVFLRQALDLQGAMVVYTRGPEGRRWWWLSRGQQASHWASWRRAVTAHGVSGALPAQGGGS